MRTLAMGISIKKCFSNSNVQMNHLRFLLKGRFLYSTEPDTALLSGSLGMLIITFWTAMSERTL